MIQSRPQPTALVAVSLFVLGALAVDIWLLMGLINNPSNYFVAKLITVPILLVIVIIVASESYSSTVNLTLDKGKLTYHYLWGAKQKHPLSDINHWQEEVVKRKNSAYHRLSIHLVNGKKLHLSNHENSHYDKVVNYLSKKVKR